MPLIGRPMLSTMVLSAVRRDGRPDRLLDLVDFQRGLLDSGSRGGADMQRDLRALDRREEVAPEKRNKRERSEDGDHEADDEQSSRGRARSRAGGGRRRARLRTGARSRAESA